MRCYFLLKGHIASVEILTGPSDEEAKIIAFVESL
jgi:hypothetical protein